MTDQHTVEVAFSEPHFKLTGTCPHSIQETAWWLNEVTNSQPWQGHAAGSLYITSLDFGGGGTGEQQPFEIGFRRRTPEEGSFGNQPAMDYAKLPPGVWSEVTA